MSRISLSELTPTQSDSLENYREKWQRIAFSPERLDRERTTASIVSAYAAINRQAPNVLFFDSPLAAVDYFNSLNSQQIVERPV